MEQCDYITNSDDVRAGLAPVHPTTIDLLRQRVALSYKPYQESTVTTSEAVFLASLNQHERNYVEELRELYDEYYHGRLTRVEFDDECADAAVNVMDLTMDRRHGVKATAVRFIRAELKAEGCRARIKLRHRVEQAAYAFKVGDRRHIGGHSRFNLQITCYNAYKSARRHLVTKKQARNIAYSVARNMKLHSAEQLWRYMQTDRMAQAIEELNLQHFV